MVVLDPTTLRIRIRDLFLERTKRVLLSPSSFYQKCVFSRLNPLMSDGSFQSRNVLLISHGSDVLIILKLYPMDTTLLRPFLRFHGCLKDVARERENTTFAPLQQLDCFSNCTIRQINTSKWLRSPMLLAFSSLQEAQMPTPPLAVLVFVVSEARASL